MFQIIYAKKGKTMDSKSIPAVHPPKQTHATIDHHTLSPAREIRTKPWGQLSVFCQKFKFQIQSHKIPVS